jgi:hypothetical protein
MQRKLSTFVHLCPPLSTFGKGGAKYFGKQKQRHIQNTRMLFGSTFLKVEQKQRHIQNTRMLFGSTFLKGG